MHLLWIKLTLSAFMVMTAAQPPCDPTTQYEHNGKCCRMCPEGTKMTLFGDCQSPDCKECEENEYMDKYTQESQCEPQPYCDPNKNFQMAVHKSKTERTVCQCELGFHCSSESCLTCVAHKKCGPGEWAAVIGDQRRDTQCKRCPNGTFSTETSWNSVCKEWTKCESGYRRQRAGTHTSDIICEPSRDHVIPVVIIVMIVIAFICGVLIWCFCTGKSGHLKNCVESCLGERPQQLPDDGILLPPPAVHIEEESMSPSQEESKVIPEENDDESGLEISSDIALTDNGNFVTQEDGKKEVLSRQESQTQTFSEYKCEC